MTTWKFSHCLRQGLYHIETNLECQDDVLIKESETKNCLTAVLSDGLGSRIHSALASRAVTRVTTRWLHQNSDWLADDADAVKVIQRDLLAKLKAEIESAAQNAGLSLNDMDCNLAFVVIFPSRNKVICGRLGDCAVCILDDNPRVMTAYDTVSLGTATVLTAKPEQLEIAILDITEKLNGFILTTDGLEGEIYRKKSCSVRHAAQNYFNTVFQGETALADAIDALQTGQAEDFDDDISIAVLSRAAQPITLPEDPQWLCRCGHRNSLTSFYCQNCHSDLLNLYDNTLIGRFQDLEHAIRYLQAHPDEEYRQLGLTPPTAPTPKTAKTTNHVQKGSNGRPNGKPNTKKTDPPKPQNHAPVEEGNVPASELDQPPGLRSGHGPKDFINSSNRMLGQDPAAPRNDPGNSNTNRDQHQYDAADANPTPGLYQWIIGASIILICVLLIFLLISMFWDVQDLFGDTPHPTTSVQQYEDYVGATNQIGQPHGIGALYEDGCFWVGTFVHGKKDGLFWKISKFDLEAAPEAIVFDKGVPVESEPATEPAKPTEPENPTNSTVLTGGTYILNTPLYRLRSDPTSTQQPISVTLNAGDAVYLDSTQASQTVDGDVWVYIRTADGHTGWCKQSNLDSPMP